MRELFDAVPAWLILLLSVSVLWLASEVAFRIARRRPAPTDAESKSHASVLLGALLGLLGLLLAFSFSIVEERFAERKSLVIAEANAIGTTFLRAGMLMEPEASRIRKSLLQYVDLRLAIRSPQELEEGLRRSQRLHSVLWRDAEAVAKGHGGSEIVALFVESLNELIDLHEKRLTVALHNRLPAGILWALYLVALLAMGIIGYAAGLGRARSMLPTLAVVVAVSVVIVLIVELDRPWARLFQVNQSAMVDLRASLSPR